MLLESVHVFLRQSKVHNINSMVSFVIASHYVVWLDIPMYASIVMNKLYNVQHLESYHAGCLYGELSSAFLHETLQGIS